MTPPPWPNTELTEHVIASLAIWRGLVAMSDEAPVRVLDGEPPRVRDVPFIAAMRRAAGPHITAWWQSDRERSKMQGPARALLPLLSADADDYDEQVLIDAYDKAQRKALSRMRPYRAKLTRAVRAERA
jgi:hypothetical protein